MGTGKTGLATTLSSVSMPASAATDLPNDDPAIDWPSEIDRGESWIRRLLDSKVGHLDAVDDVFQEVASAVLKQRARPTDPDKVSPWLRSVVIRQSAEYLRRKGRRERLIDSYASDQDAAGVTTPSPREWVMQAEIGHSLEEALKNLVGDDREILNLKYHEKLRYHDMARRLGITEKAVEHRLLRARKALRVALAQQHITEWKP